MLTEPQLNDALAAALAARTRVRESYSTEQISDALAATARRWSRPDSHVRSATALALEAPLACHRDMLDTGLRYLFGAITKPALTNWAVREIGSDQPSGGAARRRFGPGIVLHALAGNVPGQAIAPIAACLLARSVCLLRESLRQPILTRAFVETLAEEDAFLAAMVVPLAWPASDQGTEALVLRRAAHIELYGSDTTLAEIAARHPGRKLALHGARTSIGLLPQDAALREDYFAGFAEDAVLYEGKGCLSLQLLIVEGGMDRARRAAAALANALANLERRWPRRPQDVHLEVERRAFIDQAELAAASGAGELWRGEKDAWCVRLLPERARFRGSPGLRCLVVAASEGATESAAILRRLPAVLAGAALAGIGEEPASTAFEAGRATLEDSGATWICAPGRLQAPPIDWPLDGVPRLAALVDGA